MQRVSILGATGSIGRSTLDVIARHPDRFRVVALTAERQVDQLAQLCAKHGAVNACIADASLVNALEQRLAEHGSTAKVLSGKDGLLQIAGLAETDCVVAAIVGAAGLEPTLAAARLGKKLLLANKESLVMAGPIFMETVRKHGAMLLPIDSEHNAIFQCMPELHAGEVPPDRIRRILLTGSGGPFRSRARADLRSVSPEEACAHPNWVMGRKISVDSATMMNKGLEVIEAHWLFGVRPEQIQVVVHPQSVIHSMVEYADGSVLAQLGNPDMRTPIAQALAYPDRIDAGVPSLDLFGMSALTFEEPNFERFPGLRLAYEALRTGGTAPTVLNAANEIAVAAFLDGRLPFLYISTVIDETLQSVPRTAVGSIEDVLEADRRARSYAAQVVGRSQSRVA
ncbi:MAG: 1-deoxy-D-xylulose-5-phosphate reductoisomerase [Betaproteobacteria bacterium RIFCSPLOWO2_12_FULL_63_13]|nr:MAG: 1-deoxy-D-xylulose-5-phosphate reductoisomerase [Betaproteobacteria bacterium RIFCSPLOWO2_02_FULL_63_19]OGA49418.1 MAG: 1-deoxy-D-xylulose-5-phosphate reductoisomerase [Betaproteobacteria bacterium RIFCSPLOWO2_12_FULL_63_13]